MAKCQMCFGPVFRITPYFTGPECRITLEVMGSLARIIIQAVTGLVPVILRLHLPRILTTCLYGV